MACRAARPFFGNRSASVIFRDGSEFHFDLLDPYWNKLRRGNFRYEAELEHLFNRILNVPYLFVDCGANHGYWSVLVSSEMLGSKPVLSIEASGETFRKLERNHQANAERFRIFNKAIFDEDGRQFAISSGSHAGRHIEEEGSGNLVESTRVDTLVENSGYPNDQPVVLKLDVEGVEVQAVKGSARLMERDFIFVYEDHGKDKSHEPTRYMLDTIDLPVFFLSEEDKAIRITDADQLGALKKHAWIGYNCVSCHPTGTFFRILDEWASETAS
jgi:FkbM family methyltransferase